MGFNIYDDSLNRVGEISTILSSTWEEKYCDKGLCQLVVSNSPTASQLLVPGRFVGQTNKDTLWQIGSKEKRDGALWVNGYTANYTLLNDRVYTGTYKANNIESGLRTVVSGQRPAPIVALGMSHSLTATSDSEHTYPTLFSLAKDLCGEADYGFRFVHDRAAHKLKFEVYDGAEKPNAKFAEAFGNLSGLILQQSNNDYCNVAYVAGAGQGDARVIVTAGDTGSSGLNRHEMYVDARDLWREDGQSLSDYENVLRARGREKLNEKNRKLSVSFAVNPDDFGVTYSLGDIIYCILPDDALKLFVRVIAFEETIEKNQRSISVTIGSPLIQTIGG